MGENRVGAWSWIPCLYFLEGLPNTVVMTVSVLFYTSLGMSATSVAALTSALYLPWVIKPFWSPLVDTVSTKRKWILACALAFALAFFALSISPFSENWAMLSISGHIFGDFRHCGGRLLYACAINAKPGVFCRHTQFFLPPFNDFRKRRAFVHCGVCRRKVRRRKMGLGDCVFCLCHCFLNRIFLVFKVFAKP